MTEQALKPYGGPHAGNLHHVMNGDQVERPATALEVRLYQEAENNRQELRHLREAMQHIARTVGAEGQDHNAVIKAVSALTGQRSRKHCLTLDNPHCRGCPDCGPVMGNATYQECEQALKEASYFNEQ